MCKVIVNLESIKQLRNGHPWIYSGGVKKISGEYKKGSIVEIYDGKNNFFGYGYINPDSKIMIRILEYDIEKKIDKDWIYNKIKSAYQKRLKFINQKETNAFRILFAEADFFPGLIIDKYDNVLVIQSLTAGIDFLKKDIIEILVDYFNPLAIYERSDINSRKLESLPIENGILYGNNIDDYYVIKENDLYFNIDFNDSQKTGYYLDQRENRKIIREYCKNRKVLDCFCYTGGFTINALEGDPESIISIDSSEKALELLEENLSLNGYNCDNCKVIKGDVFSLLREFNEENKRFDLIILDPPKLCLTRQDKDKALRAYKDLNMNAMKILNKDGILITFSCSGSIDPIDFKTAIEWAATDAKRECQIIKYLSQGLDHPIRLNYRESEYLKGFIIYVN